MKAYSLDLRQKIIDVYNKEEISQRQLAQRFNVALSFVFKLLRQYRTRRSNSNGTENNAARIRGLSSNCTENHAKAVFIVSCSFQPPKITK